jgi:DNA-binding transcriptional LysR family regulator
MGGDGSSARSLMGTTRGPGLDRWPILAVGRCERQYSFPVEPSIELRQLRYFVAVADELHFGRAAERLHMSQSPLSRAIRELERELGVELFVRTTRRVELTLAGTLLLERAPRALAEIDGAVADARGVTRSGEGVLGLGFGPFCGAGATGIVDALRADRPNWKLRLEQELTPESLRRVAAHELVAAVVMESPAAARRHAVRVDALKDEPLLAALPRSHRYASEATIPIGEFVAEVVLLPREPPGRHFNAWLRGLIRGHGFELERTMGSASSPWDRTLPPVASGEAVSVMVADWAGEPSSGLVAVPFDPALSFPTDLVSRWPPDEEVTALVHSALRVRDSEAWLTERRARTELPED